MPRLDVVVPCYGQHALTYRMVRSFRKHAPDWARLILVDNGRGLPLIEPGDASRLDIKNSENLGFVRATNMGICASDADYVCLQNNDTEIFAGCYERLIADLEANPDIALMSPISSECNTWLSIDTLQERWGWYAEDAPDGHEQRAAYVQATTWPLSVHRPSMVPFFCTVMPRATIDRFGLLSTDYGLGLGDDDDYCRRVRDGGMECGLSLGTYVYHVGRATFSAEYTPEEMTERESAAAETFAGNWGHE